MKMKSLDAAGTVKMKFARGQMWKLRPMISQLVLVQFVRTILHYSQVHLQLNGGGDDDAGDERKEFAAGAAPSSADFGGMSSADDWNYLGY